MNFLSAIPPKVRFGIYVVYGVGSLLAAYLGAKGVIGPDEIALWSGLGAFFGVTAASNVDWSRDQEPAGRHADH